MLRALVFDRWSRLVCVSYITLIEYCFYRWDLAQWLWNTIQVASYWIWEPFGAEFEKKKRANKRILIFFSFFRFIWFWYMGIFAEILLGLVCSVAVVRKLTMARKHILNWLCLVGPVNMTILCHWLLKCSGTLHWDSFIA